MDTASLTGIIKTVFFLIVIYYAVAFIMRLLAPVLVQQVVKKAEQNFKQQYGQQQEQQQQYNQQQYTQQQQAEPKKTESKKTVGEYIDFEELD